MKRYTFLMSLAVGSVLAQEPGAGHDMASMDHSKPRGQDSGPSISENVPAVTDSDRAAAFPDLGGMSMREHMDDNLTNVMVLLDRLEKRDADGSPLAWDANIWVGRDFNKLLLRTEGEIVGGRDEDGNLEAFWVRPVARWWELAIGARHDFRPEQSRSWLALGVVGLAPYRLQVEATAYVGEGGRTALGLQTEYELLLTNRLILQPRLEINVYGRDDRNRGIGAGLSDLELGLRLRYEIRREFAPYLGIAWVNKFGSTADIARGQGGDPHELQALAGLRVWY